MPLAPPLQQVDRTFVLHRGRRLIYFGGCDYFRLASHPAVIRAAKDGLDDFGLNVAASRSTTGNHRLYAQLERAVASFFSAESALLVGTGYATNLVVAQGIAGDYDCALVDERSHASVWDAVTMLGCETVKFRHRDPADLARHIKPRGRRSRLVLFTDGMFSHDGSAAPLREYSRVLPASALLVVDDAHGAGVLGKSGRGTLEHEGRSRDGIIQTISLSKAFGAYGGAVLCPAKLREQLVSRSRLFTGNTPLPLPLANAALTSLRLLRGHKAWRSRMNANAEKVKAALRAAGVPVPDHPGPIIAIVPPDGAQVRALEKRLLKHGVYPSLIRYPGGPAEGYFRFMISSQHTGAQIEALATALAARP